METSLVKPVRLNSPRNIRRARKEFCERCGARAQGGAHHMKSRGSGGGDHPWNLIQLCGPCHRAAQDYLIPVGELVSIVARRECATISVVRQAIGLEAPS